MVTVCYTKLNLTSSAKGDLLGVLNILCASRSPQLGQFSSPELNLKGMRWATSTGQKTNRQCSHPQRRTLLFLTASVYETAKRKKTQAMHTVRLQASLALGIKIGPRSVTLLKRWVRYTNVECIDVLTCHVCYSLTLSKYPRQNAMWVTLTLGMLPWQHARVHYIVINCVTLMTCYHDVCKDDSMLQWL